MVDLRKAIAVLEPDASGAHRAVNAARGQAATTLRAVADGGRLATITGDPPAQQRGINVSDIYVKADGKRLDHLVRALADGTLSLDVTATLPLANAAAALQSVTTGRARGAIVLTPDAPAATA